MGMDMKMAIIPEDPNYVPTEQEIISICEYFIESGYASCWRESVPKYAAKIPKDSIHMWLKGTTKLRNLFLYIAAEFGYPVDTDDPLYGHMAKDFLTGIEIKTWGLRGLGELFFPPDDQGFLYDLLGTEPGDEGYFGEVQFTIEFPFASGKGLGGNGLAYYRRVNRNEEIKKMIKDISEILHTPMKLAAESG